MVVREQVEAVNEVAKKLGWSICLQLSATIYDIGLLLQYNCALSDNTALLQGFREE